MTDLDNTPFEPVASSPELPAVEAPGEEVPAATSPVIATPPDPFADITALKLSQDFASSVGLKKVRTVVPVRKPHRQEFVRVHPDAGYRLDTMVLELKEDRENYLVARALWPDLIGELKPVALYTTISRQDVLFLWPVRLPGEDGKIDEWSRSAQEAAQLASESWVKVAADMALGAYEVFQPTGVLPDPVWPEEDFKALLRIAFKGRYIEDWNHPVLRRLRGES